MQNNNKPPRKYRPPRHTLSERIVLGRMREQSEWQRYAEQNRKRDIANAAARALTMTILAARGCSNG